MIAPLEREIARAVRANGTQPDAATIGKLIDFTFRALGATPPG